MGEVVGVWTITGRERMPSGKWGLVTACPDCEERVVQPRYALKKSRRCQACFVRSVYKGGNRSARHKAKYNLLNNQAKKRGFQVTLTDEQLDELWSQPCFYCGKPPSNKIRAKKSNGTIEEFVYSGLDRVDNSKGYTYDNVVPACRECNRAKETMTAKEFYEWIVGIATNIENLVLMVEWESN